MRTIKQVTLHAATREELLREICRVLCEDACFAMSWIGWHHPQTGRLSPVAVWGDSTDYLRAKALSVDDRAEGQGPAGTSFREQRLNVNNDLRGDPDAQRWSPEPLPPTFGASAAVPIREAGMVRGVLSVYASTVGFFRVEEVLVMEEVARDVSFALDRLVREDARKRAEVKLRNSDNRYQTLFDYAPDGIMIWDTRGHYLDANPAACRILGYTHAELVQLHAPDVIETTEGYDVENALRDIIASVEYRQEWRLRRKDGFTFPADVIATVMPDTSILVVIRDISARKQAETSLRESHENLESKVAARTQEVQDALVRAESADRVKSAFLATMSHELRTPLNSIIGFTGILLAKLAGPLVPEQAKQLGMVRGSARHLLELINDVLDISKIEAEQLEIHAESFPVRASLERVLAMVQPQATTKGLSLQLQLDPAVSDLVSDRRRVEQILLNLVNNALKFTERGGVTLHAELVGEDVRFRVCDTGIGIRSEDQATLFQPFRQLDTGLTRRHEGTGLGLAICLRLTSLLGGSIAAHSVWERGTEIVVTLPLIGTSRP